MGKKLTVGQLDMSEESSKVEQVAKLLASEETYDPSQDDNMGDYKEPQKPAPSLFSAIFEDNDDDSDDEDSDADDLPPSTSEQANPKIIPTPAVKEVTVQPPSEPTVTAELPGVKKPESCSETHGSKIKSDITTARLTFELSDNDDDNLGNLKTNVNGVLPSKPLPEFETR